jgi:hypothetical protein
VVGAVNGGFLPKSCRGEVADGFIHIADWHATFAGLANVEIEETGPRKLDSIDVWPHIASCGKLPSPRKTGDSLKTFVHFKRCVNYPWLLQFQ